MAEPDHKRCLGCGYILDGLPEPRCPECGRGFDPGDWQTYYVPDPRAGRKLVIVALVGAAACALPVALFVGQECVHAAGIYVAPALLGLELVGIAGVFCSMLTIGCAWDRLRRRHLTSGERRRTRQALLISAAAVLLVVSSCPLSRGSGGSLHYGPFVLRPGSGANR